MSFEIKAGILIKYNADSNETAIVIPDSVVIIGDSAFEGCSSLESITIPTGVTGIGNSAFKGCSSLKSITIPDCVTKSSCRESGYGIGHSAFEGCSQLADIFCIPTALPAAGLRGAALLTWLRYPEKLNAASCKAEVLKYFFLHKKKVLPQLFKEDLVYAITLLAENNKLKAAELEEVYLRPAREANASQCVAYLLDWQSKNDSPEKAEKRMMHEFEKDPYCAEYMKKLWKWESNEDGTLTLISYKGADSEVIVPPYIGKKTVTAVGRGCFIHATSDICKVVLPDTILEIGDFAFKFCANLSEINIPPSVRQIGKDTFALCHNLKRSCIPESAAVIKDGAFKGCEQCADSDGFVIFNNILFGYFGNATELKLPDNIRVISEKAFRECRNLTGVTIPDTVVSIGTCAFEGCRNLVNLEIPDSVISIGEGAFSHCPLLADENGLVIIRNVLYWCNRSLKSVVIPEGVTGIGPEAFSYCSDLESITIPNSVVTIGKRAFLNCVGITNIAISDSVRRIESSVFDGCRKLEKIVIPREVTYIGTDALDPWSLNFDERHKLTIEAPAGSYAAEYAAKHKIRCIKTDD